MSHFTTIKTQIKDITALEAACRELNLPIQANTKARGYAGQSRNGDYVIQLRGPYDHRWQRTRFGGWRRDGKEGFGLWAESSF